MRRRNFILTGLLSIPALTFGKILDFKVFNRPLKGIFIKANESRFDGEQKQLPTNYYVAWFPIKIRTDSC